uniref:MORN repeat containing 4 n=1 Tax=Hippocampus comes TaxID=109280 RepID=A0A3Q2Y609_HIPCM
MQGKGILTLENGESYDGEWKNGLADGMGEYTKTDGSKYMGKHSGGKRDGNGVISWRT